MYGNGGGFGFGYGGEGGKGSNPVQDNLKNIRDTFSPDAKVYFDVRSGTTNAVNPALACKELVGDELSNGITHRFNKRNQIEAEPILRELKVFNRMVKYGRRLYEEIAEKKLDDKKRLTRDVTPPARRSSPH